MSPTQPKTMDISFCSSKENGTFLPTQQGCHEERSTDRYRRHPSYGTSLNNKSLLAAPLQVTSPSSTTTTSSSISPNDDDESLYLLWTHQLLIERGFTPSPMESKNSKDGDDNDDDGISSVSSMSADNDVSLFFSTPPSVTSPSYTNSHSMLMVDTSDNKSARSSPSSSASFINPAYSIFSLFRWCFPK